MGTTVIDHAKIFLRPPMAVTLRDATEYDVDTIAWQSGNTIRYTFNGTPDLSILAVDDTIRIKSSGNASNDGTFTITAVDDTADWIEVTNANRSDGTDDEASDSPAVAYEAEVLSRYVASGDPLTLTPEVKTYDNENSDASEIEDVIAGKIMLEYLLEELAQADITAVNSRAGVLEVVTDKGGANSAGMTFRLSDCDHIRMLPAEEFQARLQTKKVVPGGALATVLSTLYSLTDNT